jgi:hypothetical protein
MYLTRIRFRVLTEFVRRMIRPSGEHGTEYWGSVESDDLFCVGRVADRSGLKNRDFGRTDPSRLPRGTLYAQKLTLSSPRSGGRSAGIVRSRNQATEFFLVQSS